MQILIFLGKISCDFWEFPPILILERGDFVNNYRLHAICAFSTLTNISVRCIILLHNEPLSHPPARHPAREQSHQVAKMAHCLRLTRINFDKVLIAPLISGQKDASLFRFFIQPHKRNKTFRKHSKK